ncbi:MAG: HMA2 domain-containing protein [Desulfobaccales bacterium]
MMVDSSYIHSLEGRLRIKIPQVKGAADKALEVEAHLQHFAGVESVTANPITGNVLILYNPRLIDQWRLIPSLKELGYLYQSSPKAVSAIAPAATPGIVEKVTTTVTASLMEVALSWLVAALV